MADIGFDSIKIDEIINIFHYYHLYTYILEMCSSFWSIVIFHFYPNIDLQI